MTRGGLNMDGGKRHRTRGSLRTRLALTLLLLTQLGGAPVATAQQDVQPNDAILQDALVHGISMGIPGLSVAIGVGDKIIWTGTAGFSDLLQEVPVTTNDRFGVGSITKTFVARVILQLVEEGMLELEKTPADYLDSPIIRNIYNTDTATLRQILNHQSGIPTWEFQKEWIPKGRGAEMELDHIWGKTEAPRCFKWVTRS